MPPLARLTHAQREAASSAVAYLVAKLSYPARAASITSSSDLVSHSDFLMAIACRHRARASASSMTSNSELRSWSMCVS